MVKKSDKIDLIVKAINKVMISVTSIEKNSNVGQGNSAYKGTMDMDVKLAFKTLMAENGLVLLQTGIDEKTKVFRWQEEVKYGNQPAIMKTKQSVFTKATVTYILAHESDQWIELQGYGHGIDAQDKGAGKVTTYALKNILLYTFLTPVGDIDDTDTTHSDDHQTPQSKSNSNAEPQPLVKDSEQYKTIVKSIKDKKLTNLKQINYPVDEKLQKELQKLIDAQRPKLVKDSKEWKLLIGYIEVGKVKSIEQLLLKLQMTKAIQKEVEKLIDDKVNQDIIDEQLEKEKKSEGDKRGVDRLPVIPEDVYKKLIEGKNVQEITEALQKYRMLKDQRDVLTKLAF